MTAVQPLKKDGGQVSNPWKPYPAYKPSGVEWLDDVPEGWDVRRSDRIIETERRQISPSKFAGIEVFHYSIPAVQEHGTGILENGDDVASGKQRVTEPVVMVSRLNPRKATVCRAEPQAALTIASTEFVALKARKCDLRFLEYLVNTEPFRQRLDSWVQSVTRSHQRVSPEHIYRFWNAWPDSAEQRAIADFLDRETGKIDRLVVKKRELIEKLKEERAALISRAVTRGLNPDAKLKSSGVEWLGDVPTGWTPTHLKRVVTVCGRIGFRGYTTDDLVDEGEGALALGGTNLTEIGKLDLTKRTYLSWHKYEESPEIKVSLNDLLIGQRGTCGRVVIIDRDIGKATINPSLVLLKQPRMESRFLCYWLMGRFVQSVFDSYLSATAVPMLSQEQIGGVPVCCPPPPEQRAIADHLDRETGKIDRLAAKVEEAIGRLQEYRAALITAAVTGKIDVSTGLNAGVREVAAGEALAYPESKAQLLMAAESSGKDGAWQTK